MDSKYLAPAFAAANFVTNHMYDGTKIVDTVRISADFSITKKNCTIPNVPVWSYTTGFAVWGLAVLATHNASYLAP